jgi:short-subunit dehydrogenase
VTVVFPGAINTNIKVNSGLKNVELNTETHSNMALSPGIAADIIVQGMETNKARVMVGKDAKFMDFLVRINPAKASKLIFEKMKSKLEM